ncbi:pentatricopeptide repeat-containing protein At2g40720-like [Selaginella moellendorffii]|uniref:pentatricopeptide repeat-containing protein At2g40720-like n=1 Tax=Selaginella moellendorffii TaxID=88036 RepID=UPI000D1CD8D8|nr:pentatricopeptide repeat-containing protein At2g40720-like [Selaginella moellendorffii]|eukprot:XP_024541074.1 pentatricopeptide repeat-containing protein At2g40720-like [Selaginella moellendorffii]
MYSKCGSLAEARKIFESMVHRSLVSWNSIIMGCVVNGESSQALDLFARLREEKILSADSRTFVAAVKACSSLAAQEQGLKIDGLGVLVKVSSLDRGRVLHEEITKAGLESHTFVASSLVDMYIKCGSIGEARKVFEKMDSSRDEVVWNSMILGLAQSGQGGSGLELFDRMQEEGFTPSSRTFVAAIKACSSLSGLRMDSVKKIQAQARRSGCELDLFVGNSLLDAYAKCGSVQEAREIFKRMEVKDEVTWNSIIQGFASSGQAALALEIFSRMEKEGSIKPTSRTYAGAFTACSSLEDDQRGLEVYSQFQRAAIDLDACVARALIEMLAKFGRTVEARRIFESAIGSCRDAAIWSSMITGYSQCCEGELAFQLLLRMIDEGIDPQPPALIAALNCFANVAGKEREAGGGKKIPWLERGRVLHSFARATAMDMNLENSLVNFYAKCGSMEEASVVFHGMIRRDVVSWTSMILGHIHRKDAEKALELFQEMENDGGLLLDARAYAAAVTACSSLAREVDRRKLALERGSRIHSRARQRGVDSDVFLENTLVDFYAKCGTMAAARGVFEEIRARNVVSWNALIMGYALNGHGEEALDLYAGMLREKLEPDAVTLIAAIKACVSLGSSSREARWLEQGRIFHGKVLRSDGFQLKASVTNTLLDMYAKFARILSAWQLFDSIPQQTIVSWNSIIMGSSQCGQPERALGLFQQMKLEGFVPDSRTFIAAFTACGVLGEQERNKIDDDPGERTKTLSSEEEFSNFSGRAFLSTGVSLHSELEETLGREVEKDVFVGSALVDMYAKCGSMALARQAFERMAIKDVVSWTTLIMGYSQAQDGEQALKLFAAMRQEGFTPDSRTYIAALNACSILASMETGTRVSLSDRPALLVKKNSLRRGLEIHSQLEEDHKSLDTYLGNTLVDMYAKCGFMPGSQRAFDRMLHRDVVSWSALILGYALTDQSSRALGLFALMQQEHHVDQCRPNSATFVAALKACVSSSNLEIGREIHCQVLDSSGSSLEHQVANSLIDLYGKCGAMHEAKQVFDSMKTKEVVAWNALIAGFARQGDAPSVLGLLESMKRERIQPSGVTFLHALGVCCHAGLVEEAREIFQSMSCDYGMEARMEHYTCMVDLLGRGNHLEEAFAMVAGMPFQPDAKVWMTFLGNCHKWGNVEFAKVAFDSLKEMEDEDCAAYILMTNLYTSSALNFET